MFDKIYVLSLRKDKERRNKISQRLSHTNLDYEFFDAYDGSLYNHLWKKLNNRHFSNANYVACTLSHLAIYQDALNKGFNKILILEDDVIPHSNLNFINQLNLPKEYDLLYFGFIPLTDDCTYWNYNVFNDRFLDRNIFRAKNLWGLFAYSPSSQLMRELIEEYSESFPMELDRWFVQKIQKRNNSFGIVPQPFCHDITKSNNTGFIDDTSLNKSIDSRMASKDDYLI